MSKPSELVDHFVYRAWNAEGRLLYVGCSKHVEKRLTEHKGSRAAWFPLMRKVTVDGPYSYSVARSVELEAIRTEDPSHSGQTPRALASRRERNDFFESVMQTAMRHGESWSDACHQARIASDFRFDNEEVAA